MVGNSYGQGKLPECPDPVTKPNSTILDYSNWTNCFGKRSIVLSQSKPATAHFDSGRSAVYEGNFLRGMPNGWGEVKIFNGNRYVGEFKDGNYHGEGIRTTAEGRRFEGIWENNNFIRQADVNPPSFADSQSQVIEQSDKQIASEAFHYFLQAGAFISITDAEALNAKLQLSGYNPVISNRSEQDLKIIYRVRLGPYDSTTQAVQIQAELKSKNFDSSLIRVELNFSQKRAKSKATNTQRLQANQSPPISIYATATQPDSSGVVTINIQTNTDTSSLKINGEELGGKVDGSYSVKRVARIGQETKFILAATDVYGNTDTKTISVSRTIVESKVTYQQLNPDRIKRQPERDAVAVIIGISNYKSLPKAEFAKDDAQVFYDYAIRALGVKPGNIKLLMDEQADAEEIYTAFKTWLPARVKSTTDVYVFYSGHGLPTQDGSGLYWLPQRANRDLISKTGILLSEVNSDIQASKPKSVTLFMDACYSGQARGGETLVASARPIALKSQPTTFPANFTVISASQADQISSSSPDLQHGIFSYYLMRGMEGEADLNKDGKITLDETQQYLSENVGRHARTMNRQQEPQVIGDGSKVLVGR